MRSTPATPENEWSQVVSYTAPGVDPWPWFAAAWLTFFGVFVIASLFVPVLHAPLPLTVVACALALAGFSYLSVRLFGAETKKKADATATSRLEWAAGILGKDSTIALAADPYASFYSATAAWRGLGTVVSEEVRRRAVRSAAAAHRYSAISTVVAALADRALSEAPSIAAVLAILETSEWTTAQIRAAVLIATEPLAVA